MIPHYRKRWVTVLRWVLLALLVFACVFPIYFMLTTSFKYPIQTYEPSIWLFYPTLANYQSLFRELRGGGAPAQQRDHHHGQRPAGAGTGRPGGLRLCQVRIPRQGKHRRLDAFDALPAGDGSGYPAVPDCQHAARAGHAGCC